MLQFQPPQDPGAAIRSRWAGSLDDIFKEYEASRQASQARQLQDLALRDKYNGVNPLTDLNAAQRAQGLAGPTIIPSRPAIPEQPNPGFISALGQPTGAPMLGGQDPRAAVQGMMAAPTPEQPAVPEQTQYHENPVIAALQRHVQTQRGAAQTEQRLKESEIAKNLGGASDSHYTPDQAAALLSTSQDPAEIAKTKANLAGLYPGGRIPKDFAHTAATNNRLSINVGEKQSQMDTKRLTALGDALDPSKARAGAFGVSKQVYDRAERLQSMANAAMGNPDKRQMEELAIGVNAMLSGSNTGAQNQVKALLPASLVGDANKFKEWLTNNPTGTGQQEFVKRLNDTIAREKATAADQIKRTQMQRAARYADLEKSHPDEFANVLESNGIDPAEYKSWGAGGHKAMSAVQGSDGGGATQFQSGKYKVTVHP